MAAASQAALEQICRRIPHPSISLVKHITGSSMVLCTQKNGCVVYQTRFLSSFFCRK